MRNTLKTVAFSLCLLAPSVGFAQDDRDARLVVAKEYVTSAVADMDMPRVIEQMWQPLVQQIETSTGTTLTPVQLEKINALYQETYATKMTDIMGAQDEIMADLLTLPELEALRDFYASEHGRAVMIKMPDIIAKQQPQIMEMVQATMPVIMPQLQAIIAAP